MKTLLLAFCCAAGCGTSDPRTWDACTDARCSDPSTTFAVIADGAEIVGSYDPVGPPDPYLCLTLGDKTHCSSEISDTSLSITTTDLDAGGIQFDCENGTRAAFRFELAQ